MASFTYFAYTADGRKRRCREEAASPETIKSRARLNGRVVVVDTLRESRSWFRKPRNRRLSKTEIMHVFEQLELQLGAGVLTNDALLSMIDSAESPRVRSVLDEIYGAIRYGNLAISEAFGLFPRTFPAEYVAVIRAGERAGAAVLAERFGDLRDRLELYCSVRDVTARAFQYPALVMVCAAAFVGFVFTFLIPVLSRVLETVDVPLPPLTARLVWLSSLIADGWPILIGGCVIVPLGCLWLRKLPALALLTDGLILRVPFVGTVYRSLACSTVFRTYASLYKAGSTAPENLELCSTLVRNRAMRAAIAEIRSGVIAGDELSVAFRKANCFPADACAMVKTGENSSLDESMRRAAVFHATHAKKRIDRAVWWLEPIAIMVLGLFVGTIVYAFFSPILSIYEGIR